MSDCVPFCSVCNQHAANEAGLGRLIADFHGQLDRVLGAGQDLRGGILDAALIVWKKFQRFDLRQGRAPFLAQPDQQLIALDSGRGRRRLRARQFAARGGKQRRLRRIGRAGLRADRHGQLQVGVFRNADIGADQPACLGRKRHRCAALQIFRGRDLHQMHGVLGVAVVHQRSDDEAMRRRPDDVSGGKSWRQLPGELGRLT